MAYTTIDDSSLFRSTTLYTGDASAGRSLITGTFAPDTLWFKSRSATGNHHIYGTNQGTQKFVSPNSDNGQGSNGGTDGITAFNSTGVTMGGNSATNESGTTFVVWSWLADGVGSANGDGSITTTATSANTTSGFSVVTYTGTGSAATIGHGLGSVPKMIMVKRLDGTANWRVYQASNTSEPATEYLILNLTSATSDNVDIWNDTAPTSSVFSVGTSTTTNASGGTFIAYCFAEVAGYSKFGSYTGNGNADGTFVYTGFRPAFVMCKITSGVDNWIIMDSKRLGYNEANYQLIANSTLADQTPVRADLLSNGFKARSTNGEVNNGDYIYMAFAEAPFVNSSGVPCNAR